jgi:hypothetical protein
MSVALSLASLPAIGLLTQDVSMDGAGLWAAVALCAAVAARRPNSPRPFVTVPAFMAAMLLTSLALVTA